MERNRVEQALMEAERELARLEGELKALDRQRSEALQKLVELGIPEDGIGEALRRLIVSEGELEKKLDSIAGEFESVINKNSGTETAKETPAAQGVLDFFTRG